MLSQGLRSSGFHLYNDVSLLIAFDVYPVTKSFLCYHEFVLLWVLHSKSDSFMYVEGRT